METQQQKKTLAGAAVIVMLSLVVSRITGYARESLITAKLGVNEIGDAYNIAFLVPDLMYTLLIGGAVAAALVPVLSGHLGRNEESTGWKAVGTFFNITFLIMVAATIIGEIFAPQLIKVIATGYGREQPVEMLDLVVRLTRILFPSICFLMLAGLCNGVLYSYKRFTAASFGPALYNVFSALSIFLLSNKDRADNYGVDKVAIGVACSSFLYFLFQLAFAFKDIRKNFRFKIYLKEPAFIKLYKLAIPSLISTTVMQINVIVSARFATFFESGSVTALRIADRTWHMPLGIIAQGIATAILPALSERFATGGDKQYKDALTKSLKMVLLLSIPCAFAMAILREPIIRTLYKFTDKMTESDVTLTSSILLYYSVALIAQAISTVLFRGFFARNDTKSPLFISSATIIVNIILSVVFYNFTALGVAGMALAYTITSILNAALMLYVLNKKAGGIYIGSLARFVAKSMCASLLMSIVVYFLNGYMPFAASSKFVQVAFLGVEAMIGGGIYMTMIYLFKIDEAKMIADRIFGRFKRLARSRKAA